MRRIYCVLLFLLNTYNCFAQSIPYNIDFTVIGKNNYRYVYLKSFEPHTPLQKHQLINNKTTFKGLYTLEDKRGFPTQFLILLSNEVSLPAEVTLADFSMPNRNIVYEPEIAIKYVPENNVFNVIGGELNDLQNKIFDEKTANDKKKDSVFRAIDLSSIKLAEKSSQKKYYRDSFLFDYDKKNIEIIKKNLSSKFSLKNLYFVSLSATVSPSELREVFNLFPKNIKASKAAHSIDSILNRYEMLDSKKLYVGQIFPTFKLLDDQGHSTDSSIDPNNYTLVDFWASWCIPCRSEIPNLKDAHALFKQYGFNIVTISIDSNKDSWLKAIKDEHIEAFINLIDLTDPGSLHAQLGIRTIPANFLIDKTGKVIAINLRGPMLKRELENNIYNSLKKPDTLLKETKDD